MPSAFKRGPRTIPTSTTTAAAAGPSKELPASASSSSSSSAAATTTAAPLAAPSTWHSRPTTHPTLRPSPFPSQLPLPLFSLGLDSINDVFTGVGLPSASLALFLPHQDGDDEDERTRVGAAQGYADLMCKYAAAQGMAAGQSVLVVGEGTEVWMRGLMGWAGQDDREGTASKPEPAPSIPAAARQPQPPAEEDKLKVAFRYERLKKINDEAAEQAAASSSSSGSSTQPYVHPFDLSTRISPRVLQKAKEEGRLVVHSIAHEDDGDEQPAGDDSSSSRSRDSYSEAWEVIQRTVSRWQQESSHSESPLPARIILPSLSSPSWRVAPGRTHAGEAYRLLLRVKTLLRQTAWPSAQGQTQAAPAMPIIAISSPSAWLLLGSSGGADVAHRLASLSDGALSLSSFAADPRTRFLAESPASSTGEGSASSSSSSGLFTGALRVLRTPAIGSLRGPSIRASALRGMASVSGAGGGGTGGEGGSSENALGFKVRRKGVKVDVMGRDLVANWGASGEEKKEVKKPQTSGVEGEKAKGVATAAGDASTAPKRTTGAPSVSVGIEEASVAALPAPRAPAAAQQQPPARTPLKGLAALRARGLAAQGADKGEQQSAPPGEGAAKQKAVHGANHDW